MTDDITKALGDRIKARRESIGLSQEAVALKAGLTQGAISQLELGKNGVLVHTLVRVAAALQTTVGYLLGETDVIPDVVVDFARLSAAVSRMESEFGRAYADLTVEAKARVLCYLYRRGASASSDEIHALLGAFQ